MLLADMQAVKLGFDRGFVPLLSAVQFARLATVTPWLCDVNALGIAVGACKTLSGQTSRCRTRTRSNAVTAVVLRPVGCGRYEFPAERLRPGHAVDGNGAICSSTPATL